MFKGRFDILRGTLLARTDMYKYSHFLQYPPNLTKISSYIEPRKAKGFDWALDPTNVEVVSLGVQPFVIEKMLDPITHAHVDAAKILAESAGEPFNEAGFRLIVDKWGGFWPVTIRSLIEGTVFTPSVAQVQVTSADMEFAWVPGFIEMALLRAVWPMSTVATKSREIKKLIKHFLDLTSDDPEGQIGFKLHDFGGRGTTSDASAELLGAAHLVNFLGTDTTEALLAIDRYYLPESVPGGSYGYSIPASEHSTITSWGGVDGEVHAFDNMINQFGKPGKIYACVSDSYDIWNACENLWGTVLKQKIVDSGAILVVRPDSGDPLVVTQKVIEILGDKFGFTVNSKGYKVLNYVRIIQGDGVSPKMIRLILQNFLNLGWSADNIAFGMGHGLLQAISRDDLSYAMKASAGLIGDTTSGNWIPISKDPVTDTGKRSKTGLLGTIVDSDGKWSSHDMLTTQPSTPWHIANQLKLMYDCGNPAMANFRTFSQVRERAQLK